MFTTERSEVNEPVKANNNASISEQHIPIPATEKAHLEECFTDETTLKNAVIAYAGMPDKMKANYWNKSLSDKGFIYINTYGKTAKYFYLNQG